MTIPNITTLPPPPTREDPSNFAFKANEFLGALPQFGTEVNLFADEANNLVAEVTDIKNQIDSTYNLVLAGGSSVKWVSGSTHAEGTLVFSPINYQTYRRTATSPGSSTTDPSADAARWTQITSNTSGFLTTAGNLEVASGAGTGDAYVEVGKNRTGSGTSTIDMHTSAGVDYSFRIRRTSGLNGEVSMINEGTGGITLQSNGSANIRMTIAGTEIARWTSSRQFLMGTTTSFTFNGVLPRVVFCGSNSGDTSSMNYRFGNDTGTPNIALAKGRGASAGTFTAVANNDILGYITWQGTDGTGLVEAASIGVSASNISTGFVSGSILFRTRAPSAPVTTKAVLTPEGYFRIGSATSPSGIGSIAFSAMGVGYAGSISTSRFGNDNGGSYFILSKSRGANINEIAPVETGDAVGLVQFMAADSSSHVVSAILRSNVEGTVSAGNIGSNFQFQTRNAAGTLATRLLIDKEGNMIPVINDTAPTLGTPNQMVFSRISNTQVRLSMRGTDGTTRSVTLTLS